MVTARKKHLPRAKPKSSTDVSRPRSDHDWGALGAQWSLLAQSKGSHKAGRGMQSGGRQASISLGTLTSRASLRFWVRAPRLSHWSQIFWHRALTLGES